MEEFRSLSENEEVPLQLEQVMRSNQDSPLMEEFESLAEKEEIPEQLQLEDGPKTEQVMRSNQVWVCPKCSKRYQKANGAPARRHREVCHI